MNLARKIAAVTAGAVFAVVTTGVTTPASADTSWGHLAPIDFGSGNSDPGKPKKP